MAFLTSISGSGFGKRYELDKKQIVLGRHPDCDVTIEVGAVSRQHARVHSLGGEFEIEDLKSRNGTFLNGQLITDRAKLRDGDLIRICDVEFSFHSDASSAIMTTNAPIGDGSSFGVLMLEDDEDLRSSRSLQGKLDIRGSAHGSQLTTSPEARLKAVLEITQALGRALKLEEVLPKVLDALFKVFLQADRAFVVLRQGDELVPRWIKTRSEEQEASFRISRTVLKEVIESGEAIISLDASNDERFEMADSISDFHIRSMIVAPLIDSDGEPLGAIQMDSLRSKRQFDQGDLEILAAIATQAAVAIENAQLHEELVQKQRVEQDLDLARSVQLAFLPARAPDVEGYCFYHFYHPASQIGGDYFDYIELGDGRLAIVVADVVGHGVAAAMLMAKLSAETRFLLARQDKPHTAITKLNRRICELGVEKFVTLLCLVLDPETAHIEIVNAGHMPPLLMHADGTISQPGEDASGVPIGIIEDFEYERESITLRAHEKLLLYTDGINEAPDKSGTMFGLQRMIDLTQNAAGEVGEIGDKIVSEVQGFITGTEQADDMCLVLIGKGG